MVSTVIQTNDAGKPSKVAQPDVKYGLNQGKKMCAKLLNIERKSSLFVVKDEKNGENTLSVD